MNYAKLTLDEIKKGYRFDAEADAYICIYCNKPFKKGQVFSIDLNYYLPEHAVAKHILTEHGGNCLRLVNADTKYNLLTQNQKELMTLFYSDMPDREIAKKLGVSASTVRRQRFTFREKAKQAKFYLAVFENVFEDKRADEEAVSPIHDQAHFYDERYEITKQERAHVVETCFESLDPLRLKLFPPKEKHKVVILAKIAELLELGKSYDEKELNTILKMVFDDHITLRRYLIMYGFMERKQDGSRYWLQQ